MLLQCDMKTCTRTMMGRKSLWLKQENLHAGMNTSFYLNYVKPTNF